MQSILNSIKYGWSAARVTRLMIGVLVFAWAAFSADGMMMVLGGWLALMPLLNFSCCGSGGCDIDQENKSKISLNKQPEVTNFEEIGKDEQFR